MKTFDEHLEIEMQNAHKTQQQLSKIENGINCNMFTFLKVCQVLGMQLSMERQKSF